VRARLEIAYIREERNDSSEQQEARCTPTPSPESPRSLPEDRKYRGVTEMSCAPECPSCKATVSDIYPERHRARKCPARIGAAPRRADGEASRSSRGLLSSQPAHGTTESTCTRSVCLSRRLGSLSNVILFGVSTREVLRLRYILGVLAGYYGTWNRIIFPCRMSRDRKIYANNFDKLDEAGKRKKFQAPRA